MEILLHGSRFEDARLFSDFTWRICAVSLHTDDQRQFFFLFRRRQGCATQNMAKDAHVSWTNTLKQKLATAPIRWS
jgi:hypothetical protein